MQYPYYMFHGRESVEPIDCMIIKKMQAMRSVGGWALSTNIYAILMRLMNVGMQN